MFPCKHVLFDLQNQQSYSIWPLIQGLFPGSPFLFDSFHLFSDILISVIGMEKYPRIRELREDGDLSQAQVGRAVNLPQRTYAYYESGQRMAPPRGLCALADFYGGSVDYILGREKDGVKTRIKELREGMGLTAGRAAALLDMSQAGYLKYETGERDIPASALLKLAGFYGVSVDYILRLSDKK